MKHINIKGYGKCLPDKVVSNDDLSQIVDTSDEWIVQRTGIHNRRISDVPTSKLAYQASIQALQDAGIEANELDAIVVATMTPDNITPSVACLVQKDLNILKDEFIAFDINAACTGFIYALQIAASLLHSGKHNILVIGAETTSRIIDFQNRNTCVLFGDGAGAVVLSDDGNDEMFFYTNSIGNDEYLLSRSFDTNEHLLNHKMEASFLEMNGKEVFKFAIKANEDAIQEILNQNHITINDIDLWIPHQANIRILNMVSKRLGIDSSSMFINLNQYGNTSAASVGIALCEAHEQNRIQNCRNIVLTGFGAGLTYGAVLIRKEMK